MPATETKLVVEFAVEKDTPGTTRYAEILPEGVERGAIGTLYLRKDIAEGLGKPERLIVTVENAA